MPLETILDADVVARSLFDPKDVSLASMPHPTLLPLNGNNLTFETKYNNEESVNCLRLLEADNAIPGDTVVKRCHELGRQKAADDNIKIREANLTSEKQRPERTYAGYVSAMVEHIRAASDDFISFDVIHEPIAGNSAHCNIKMSLQGQPEKRVKNAKIVHVHSLFADQVLA